jgi:hypothetical protein
MRVTGIHIYKVVKYSAVKLLIAFVLLLSVSVAKGQQALSVIANQKGAPPAISNNDLRSVFMGERQRWSNGAKIVIALIKTNNPIGAAISKKVYDMKPDELNKYWLALVFQGKASAPFFFNSTAELQTFVSQNPGSIGVVDEPVNTADIKTIAVNGKKSI